MKQFRNALEDEPAMDFREDDIPIPPDRIPDAPVEEPPDAPVTEPDAPVREPGPEPPKRLIG